MTAMDVDHSDEEVDAPIDSVISMMARPMSKGEYWYLLDKKWFDTFKLYLNDTNNTVNNPGPIDNSPLFKKVDSKDKQFKLRENLEETHDYTFIPEDAWNILLSYFKIIDERHVIRRQVIEQGQCGNYAIVEVYPIDLKLCLYGGKDIINKSFSRVTKLSDVINEIKSTFNVPPGRETKFRANHSVLFAESEMTSPTESVNGSASTSSASSSSSSSFTAPGTPPITITRNTTSIPLPPPPPSSSSSSKNNISQIITPSERYSQTLAEIGINSGEVVTLEVKNIDGTWPSSKPKSNSNLRSGVSSSSTTTPGLCGLMNLGNTCFMNSALQCMSNCPQLTDYFLDDSYINDINEINPLGMKGQVARAYGQLIKSMWSGKHSCLVPRDFKIVLGRFSPQFSGFQQHDCQELMVSLLDGLHEDLNRILNKPYIELNTGIDKRPDTIIATESWLNYKKRNDSIIIDTFHGLLKSTLVCPDCNCISVTFDPFCYLSLPLPVKRERPIDVYLYLNLSSNTMINDQQLTTYSNINNDITNYPIKLNRLMVPKKGQISDICNSVVKIINSRIDISQTISSDSLIVTEISNHRFNKIYRYYDEYTPILEEVHIYENIEGKLPMFVYLKEIKDDGSKSLFGLPFVIFVDEANYQQVYNAIDHHIKPWFTEVSNIDAINSSTSSSSSSSIKEIPNGDVELELDEGFAYDDNNINNEPYFTMTLVNSYGSVEHEKLNVNSDIKITNRVFLAAEIKSEYKKKFYQENLQLHHNIILTSNSGRSAFGSTSSNSRSTVSLSDCINQFTTIENLGADDLWYCPQCKKHQEATKKFDLWSLPDVLIIHLKRFSYSRNWRDKLDILVDFPTTGLDMSSYVISEHGDQSFTYDLIAVANHYGGLGGGHYTAYGKNRETRSWYNFDDLSVRSASEDEVISKAAYVLLYERRKKTPFSSES